MVLFEWQNSAFSVDLMKKVNHHRLFSLFFLDSYKKLVSSPEYCSLKQYDKVFCA